MSLNDVSNYGKGTALTMAGISGGIGLTSKILSAIPKEGAIKNAFKNAANLGGFGFIASASIFTGLFLIDKAVDSVKG